MKKLFFGAAVLLVTSLSVSADTVAWWRFCDLGPEGSKAVSGNVFTNSVDVEKFPAYPKSFNDLNPGETPEYMPSTTNSFVGYEKLTVYDPVSETSHETAMSLHCPWGGNGSAKSGGARVVSDPRLYGRGEGQTGDFTFECFFRTTQQGIDRSQSMQCLAGQRSSGYEGAWMLTMHQGKLWARCTTEDENGTEVKLTASQGPTKVTADVWHHAAVTFESETGTFRFYLDYVEQTSCSAGKKSFINPGSGNPILIGAAVEGVAGSHDRSLDGDICEARISDACLTTDQFLRFREPVWHGDRVSDDPDTLLWLSLDSMDSFRESPYGDFLAANPGLVTPGLGESYGAQLVTAATGLAASIDTSVSYSQTIRRALHEGEDFANGGSLHIPTNAEDRANCSFVKILDGQTMISSQSFTQEMFYKVDHPCVTGAGVVEYSYGLMCSMAFKALVNQGSGKSFCRFKATDGDHDITSAAVVNDGKWHHAAIVYDAEAQTASWYSDYILAGTTKNVTLKSNKPESTTPWILGCARENTAYQPFDGWIDEIRITRRALQPEEFLSKIEKLPAGTLAWAHFDTDFMMLPHPFVEPVNGKMDYGDEAVITNNPRATVITDFDDKMMCANNVGALRLSGSRFYYPSDLAFRYDNFSVELFFRPNERFAAWAGPIAYTVSNGTSPAYPNYYSNLATGWMIGGAGTWEYMQYQIAVATSNAVAGGAAKTYTFPFGPKYLPSGTQVGSWKPMDFDGGKWHHLALTFARNADGTKTQLKGYWDYDCVVDVELDGTVYYSPSVHYLSFGAAVNERALQADIDEVRFSDHPLEPHEFLRKAKVPGTIILIR